MRRISKLEKARRLLRATPTLTALALSEKMGISRNYAYKLMSNVKDNPVDKIVMTYVKDEVEDVIEEKVVQEGEALSQLVYDISQRKAKIRMMQENEDTVNHPPHYKVGGIETIDFIEAKGLDYNLGNVVKYVTRSEHKGNKKEDLLKAQWYLTRAISKI